MSPPLIKSTQLVPHWVVVPLHDVAHPPSSQTLVHVCPHVPQLRPSVAVFFSQPSAVRPLQSA